MLPLSQKARRAKSVFRCQMAKMKLDFRELGRETGEKWNLFQERKLGQVFKMTGNVISYQISIKLKKKIRAQ